MDAIKEDWWVVKWTKESRVQEIVSGPYQDEEDARFAAIQAVKEKPEGTIIRLYTSIPKPSY